jgi:zinc transport system substrate-binding protein
MKRYILWLTAIVLIVVSCGPKSSSGGGGRTVTVTIPPFAWFVEQIGGDDFRVNVLLPPGADHHIWEPLPAQISSLARSEALIINGQLGFEHAWIDRFMEVNPDMKVLDLSWNIRLIRPDDIKGSSPTEAGLSLPAPAVPSPDGNDAGNDGPGLKDPAARDMTAGSNEAHDHDGGDAGHDGEHEEAQDGDHGAGNNAGGAGDAHESRAHSHGGPDPHYWMSPAVAMTMAKNIRDFLAVLNPSSSPKYDANLLALNRKIAEVDSLLRASLGTGQQRTVMIYHPALAYMGRDYGFDQVSFEDEGKNPSPARMKELVDTARDKGIKIIFIQAEYDVRNAESLSRETGAKLVVINPMNSDWPAAVTEVARALGQPAATSPN